MRSQSWHALGGGRRAADNQDPRARERWIRSFAMEPLMDFFWQVAQYVISFVQTVMNLGPETINQYANDLGSWLYVVLFLIIFAETGLVVTPILPGDSLLFAVGAVAAAPGSPIQIGLTAGLLVVAAVAGDAVNYSIGKYVGPRVFTREDRWFLHKKHLFRAQRFYEDYGGITIILARFIPIVRTFAPFVAGIGKMSYPRFAVFNVTGGCLWILSFLLGGWWFGGREVVQKNFKLVIVAIIVISVLPGVFEYLRARAGRNRAPQQPGSAELTGLSASTEDARAPVN
jgi:membrane-associated protein